MMSAGLLFVAVLGLVDLLLTLLVARRLRQVAEASRPASLPWLAPGTRIPDFETSTVDGDLVSMDMLRGRRSLVGIFTPSCEPCKVQVPAFARLAGDAFGPDQALAVVLGAAEEADGFLAMLAGHALLVREPSHGPVAHAFSARAYPAIYLLDSDGKVILGSSSAEATADRLLDVSVARS